jgi:hypothetical protein
MKEPLQFKQKPSLFVTPSKAERFAVVPPPLKKLLPSD